MTHLAVSSPRKTSIPSATAPVLLPAREHRSRLMAASASAYAKAAADRDALLFCRSGRKRCNRLIRSFGLPQKAAIGAVRTDGEKNARADNQRTVADGTKGALWSRGAYQRPPGRPTTKDHRAAPRRSSTCAISAGRWRGAISRPEAGGPGPPDCIGRGSRLRSVHDDKGDDLGVVQRQTGHSQKF